MRTLAEYEKIHRHMWACRYLGGAPCKCCRSQQKSRISVKKAQLIPRAKKLNSVDASPVQSSIGSVIKYH